MNTLPPDLLFLLDTQLNPYQTRLLCADEEQKELDLKWFYYNISTDRKCGYELIQLANRGEFSFLKDNYFIQLADKQCEMLIVETVLEALANRNEDLLLKKIIDSKHLFGVYFKESILKLPKTISTLYLHGREDVIRSFARNDEYKYILVAIDTLQHHYIHTLTDKLLHSTEIKYELLRALLEAIIFYDYQHFYELYQNVSRYDDNLKYSLLLTSIKVHNLIIFKYIYNKERYTRIKDHWLHIRQTSLIQDIVDYDAHDILELYRDLSDMTIPTWLQYLFSCGYQGPLWYKLLKLYPDTVHEIDIFKIFDPKYIGDVRYKINVDQLRTIFELSKPSRRELIKFSREIGRVKRYDIYEYVCELLASF